MLNNISLTGYMANEPDLRAMLTGGSICRFQVAVARPRTANEDREVDFINVVTMNSTADFVNKFFKKGDPISLVGRLQSRTMVEEDGRSEKVAKVYEVFAHTVEFVPKKAESAPEQEELF